jgi:hypothetical protein
MLLSLAVRVLCGAYFDVDGGNTVMDAVLVSISMCWHRRCTESGPVTDDKLAFELDFLVVRVYCPFSKLLCGCTPPPPPRINYEIEFLYLYISPSCSELTRGKICNPPGVHPVVL